MLGNGGSTAFWDAAAFGLIESRAQLVVCGEFSAKFASVVARRPVPGRARGDHAPSTAAAPARRRADGIDTYAWPHNETSTGVALPVAAGRRPTAR